MKREEIDYLFELDAHDRYKRLVMPTGDEGKTVSYVGKSMQDLSIREIVLIKRYAQELYKDAINGEN